MAMAWCQYAGRYMSFDPVAPVTEGPADSFESSQRHSLQWFHQLADPRFLAPIYSIRI